MECLQSVPEGLPTLTLISNSSAEQTWANFSRLEGEGGAGLMVLYIGEKEEQKNSLGRCEAKTKSMFLH